MSLAVLVSCEFPGKTDTDPGVIPGTERIIADHTIVDRYDDIPSVWIAEVKEMLLLLPGESHQRGYIYGLDLLEAQNAAYATNATTSGAPEGPTSDHLRISRTYWDGTSWAQSGGEEDFWTNAAAVTMMTDNLEGMRDTQSNPVAAFGFGWCWDMALGPELTSDQDPVFGCGWAGASIGGPDGSRAWGLDSGDTVLTGNSLSLQDYFAAIEAYRAAEPGTVTFLTTGPVDSKSGELAYQRYLKHEAIRNYAVDNSIPLFDYADILCWNDAGAQTTETWDGHTFQNGDPLLANDTIDYDGGSGYCHITEAGCLRLGKAMWWFLARIAGWDGT